MDVIDALKAAGVENSRHRAPKRCRDERLMDVTDVLRDRMQRAGRAPADGRRCRSLAHGALVAALIVSRRRPAVARRPRRRRRRDDDLARRRRHGPRERRHDADRRHARCRTTTPPDDAKPKPVRPPAAKAPEMTVPLPNAKPAKAPPPPTRRSRRPTKRAAARRRTGGSRAPGAPSPRPARAARASASRPAAAPGPARTLDVARLLLSRLPGAR